MPNKEKLKKIYDEISTPQEKILDLLEKIDKEKLKGDDGKDGEDGQDGRDGRDGKDGKDGQDGRDGRNGKDGIVISSEEVRDKLKELKGTERLSVFDLKDTEYLKGKDKVQWSSAGFAVVHDNTLSGDGSHSNPLSVVGLSVSSFHAESGVISDLNILTTANKMNVVLNFIINGQGLHLTSDFTFLNTTATYTTPLDSSLLGKPYYIVYV